MSATAAGVDPRTSPGSVDSAALLAFQKYNAGDEAPTRFVIAAEGTSSEVFTFNLWAMDDGPWPGQQTDDPTSGYTSRRFYLLNSAALAVTVGGATTFNAVVPPDGTVYVQQVAPLPAHAGALKVAMLSGAGGHVSIDGGSITLGALGSGSNHIGQVSIDAPLPAGTNVLGHLIVDSSGLPAGAATAAKQPALGTAGAASADVISVQGLASMTALKVDGSAVTQPVSAATLPLPTGASTVAKQPALGTAGAASADVISVQGVASMKELLVQLIAGASVIGHVILDASSAVIGHTIVDSGTVTATLSGAVPTGANTIGAVTEVLPTTGANGQATIASITVSAVVGASLALTKGLWLTANPTNTGVLYWQFGAAGGDIRTTGELIMPGTRVFLPIGNRNAICVGAAVAAEGYSYSAM